MNIVKLKISSYEIDDAILSDKQTSMVRIPCNSDTEFCMQLDGWDEHTSIPATINEQPVLLYRHLYDKERDHWVMRVA
ncbi:DUF1480 family protein [Moellerella wisconsensis]|uniref:YebV family protein n=1 Tax=Moellerella wisconsensis ATCC 35017 TaxID=1354267 RepID=A0A0N1KI35_9GAMM|nr:DUF1480 family protein [Moellerella wisconsensis]KPD02684.1 hypothetical protein M992_1839 [Moellerella wisconsensis ATCC 35017]VFS53293.1 Protein of uncharacterised function (DUF1480) [Moellerella wisconsensis]